MKEVYYIENYAEGILQTGNSWDKEGKEYRYNQVSVDATPKNGINAFYTFIKQKLEYPPLARENKIEGKVSVVFFVEASGDITDVAIHKGLGDGYGLDEAALKVMEKAKPWNSALLRGQPTRSKVVLPISFTID